MSNAIYPLAVPVNEIIELDTRVVRVQTRVVLRKGGNLLADASAALEPVARLSVRGRLPGLEAELGTVVIGGLFSSTFLTLLVVPVVYSLVDGARVGVSGWRGRRGASNDAPGSPAAPTAEPAAALAAAPKSAGYPLARVVTSRPGSQGPGTSPDRP